jgi:hypothetical protein
MESAAGLGHTYREDVSVHFCGSLRIFQPALRSEFLSIRPEQLFVGMGDPSVDTDFGLRTKAS